MSLPLHTFIKPTCGKDRRQMTKRKEQTMTVKTPVYLDYAATTPVDRPRCRKNDSLSDRNLRQPRFQQPRIRLGSRRGRRKARADIAALINADPKKSSSPAARPSPTTSPLRARQTSTKPKANTSSPSKPNTKPCSTPCANSNAKALK